MKHRFTLFALALLVLLFTLPALAQDTPVPTAEATVVSTPFSDQTSTTIIDADGDVILNQTPPDTVDDTDTADETPVEPEPWYAKYITPLLALAGILTAGLVAFNKWLEVRKTDPGTMTMIEQAYAWSPAFVKKAVVALIKQLIRLGDNLQEVLDEATDGTPYVVKVHRDPTVPPANTPPTP